MLGMTAEQLLEQARPKTDLQDLGDPSFFAGFQTLVRSIDQETLLSDRGIVATHPDSVCTRLRATIEEASLLKRTRCSGDRGDGRLGDERISKCRQENAQNKHGVHEYSVEDSGLSEDQILENFKDYYERFDTYMR